MDKEQSGQVGVRKLFPLLAFLTFCCVTFLLGEVGVRVFLSYNTPETLKKYSLPYSSATYARSLFLPVNREIEINDEKAWGVKGATPEKSKVYFINQHGYRGRSFELHKPKGLQRIVVLGGSTVFDQNAAEGQDWPSLVEEFLKQKGHANVEVINAGIPGHASSDAVGRLFTEIWQWEPDYVLIYETWNDIKYFNDISLAKPLVRTIKAVNPDADPFRNYQGTVDYLLAYSQIYVKVRNKYFAQKSAMGGEGALRDERKDDVADLGLAQFRLNMETFVDASRNMHAIPILLTQPTLVSSTNSAEDRKRIVYGYVGLSHEGILRAYEKCREIMLDVGRRKNADVLDLLPQLQGKSELFSDHDHTTTQGSREVAMRVASFLAPRLKPVLPK